MKRHPDSAELLRWACGALTNLAANHASNQALINQVGGIELVSRATKCHPGALNLQAWARSAKLALQNSTFNSISTDPTASSVGDGPEPLQHASNHGKELL